MIQEHFEDIRTWLASGLQQSVCAKNLGIRYSDWKKLRDVHPEFLELVKSARVRACTRLKNAMFESAVGHTVTVEKVMKVRTVEYSEDGKRKKETEELVPYKESVYIPPNYKANAYLLGHWAKEEGYTNADPQMLELKKKEYELKKEKADNGW